MTPDADTRLRPPVGEASGEAPGEAGGEAGSEAGGGVARRAWGRRRVLAGGIAAALLVGSGVATTRLGRGGGGHAGGTPAAADLGTARVETRTLEDHAELDGTLGYGDTTDVGLPSQGTITALPAVGEIVDRGETLVEIDGRPVPLLFGDRPLWRRLAPGVDDGPDVRQLEANLVALGVATESELTVDDNWTAATTAAVREWQDSLGHEGDGAIDPGDLVFLPGPVRVAEHPTPVGGRVGESVLGVTGAAHLVTVDLEADRQGLVEPGQAVGIVLPGGAEITGTVFAVGRVATADDDGDDGGGDGGGDTATVGVVIVPDDPAATGTLDQAPVTVRVVTSAATDVLAVPVEALVAVAEGSYAVEVVGHDGTATAVPVELGAFADGWVEVAGEVAEGDEVVVPRG